MPRVFKINVNGTDYDVTVQELTDISSQLMPQYRAAAPAAAAPAAAPGPAVVAPQTPAARTNSASGDQCAQMGGVVANILVKPGQQVSEGDNIVELEAMKMKVPVVATCSGTVSRVLVSIGDAVERGQVLLTLG